MIKVVSVRRTCLACPSQFEGTTDKGEYVYARYRGGRMRVDVAPDERAWSIAGHNTYTVYQESFGDPLDGYITFEELKEHTVGVLKWPESDGDDGKQLEVARENWMDYFSDIKTDA